MTRHSVQLRLATWTFSEADPLGQPGGFGAVYRGEGEGGEAVAIKRLHLIASWAAHRELKVASRLASSELKYVMPVLDWGEDPDDGRYYLVMPLAEESLADFLARGTSSIQESDAVDILIQITRGLEEVPNIVHRDLKPQNVLYHESVWKIADFGIARFVEDSTSLGTLQGYLTPAYAAPEQWKLQTPSETTDVYALGCMVHLLVRGEPPFSGTTEELREQHLGTPPPPLEASSPRLSSWASMMLRKAPQTRPSVSRTREVLENLRTSESELESGKLLAALGVKLAHEQAQREAAMQTEAERAEEERLVVREAVESFSTICTRLTELIAEQVPSCTPMTSTDSWRIEVQGRADLRITLSHRGPGMAFRSGSYVVAGGSILVEQITGASYLWSANLWYGRLRSECEFRWFEVGYMASPLIASTTAIPFSLDVGSAAQAATSGMHRVQIAYTKQPYVDAEDEASFQERWMRILGLAIEGRLAYPRYSPFDPTTVP